MQKEQLDAIVDGEDFPFEDWIAKASMRMLQIQEALRAHRQDHGLLERPVRSDRVA